MPNPQRRSADLAHVREQVDRLATAHGGVFRRSDLTRWGFDEAIVPAMLRRQWWVRLHHGVYADERRLQEGDEAPEVHVLRCAASLRALPGPAFAFGATAALLHGLPQQRGLIGAVQLIRPLDRDGRALRRRITSTTSLSPASIRSHHLTPADVTIAQGIPTVSRLLAALSTAAMSRREWAVATLDAAVWQEPAMLDELDGMAHGWSHLRGIGTVRSVLPLVRCGAQTPLESLSRIRLADCDLPEPELQAALHDDDGLVGYVDMLWRSLHVVGEADGLLKYETREALVAEKRREDRIRALGWPVVRWTWDEIMADPHDVARRIRRAGAHQRQRAG